MKNRFKSGLSVLILGLAGALSVSAQVPTANDGPGPSEQPGAPMEMGQEQASGPQMSGPQAPPDAEAQPGGPSGEAPAQTDQGVARVSMIHGDVSTQRGDSGDWSAAVANQPVMTGDKVSTGDNARTELQLDYANIIRLGANSKANLANLTRKDIQIQLSQGILNYTVSKDSETEPEVDSPNVSVHPSHHDGVFRIEVRPDGDTVVIVRKGEAQIATPQGSTEVHSGEMATVRGDSTSAQYKISQAPDRDDWDRWNSDRDHMIQNAHSWHHTNRYFTGSEDLDANGSWRNVPDYGDVWVPNEPDGWVPYRDGNWTYEPTYGWTWVGGEPWGWAPYHYGRWFPYGGAWAWWPGPIYGGGFYRPFWAPAYVSFWGWGGGFGFGLGFGGWGGFGWLPIGPCDWFHPWWGGYGGRFGVLNARFGNGGRFGGFAPLHGGTRFSNIRNIHDNHVGRALSTVNAAHFGAGRVSAVAATREQINGGKMMAGNMPVVPSHSSLSASGRPAAPSTVRNGGSEHFFGAVHNNVSRPASFQQQTAHLQQTMQQNHVSAVTAGGRTSAGESSALRNTPSSTMQKPSAGSLSTREMNNSSRETNSSVNRSAGNQPASTVNGNRGGFRPFTPPNSSNTRTSPSSSGNTESRGLGSPSSTVNRSTENRPMQSQPTENRSAMNNSSRDGFRPFTPPSHNDVSRGESRMSSPSSSERGSSGSYWNRTAPSSIERGSSSSGSYGRGSSGSYSRPQLDMHQPVVRGPSYGGSRSPSYGGYPSSRTPSYGGSHSAPSYGGSHSAPSSGGGHSSGGGGGHPSSGGGGHSSSGGHSGGGHH